MAISLSKAKALCTAGELTLVAASGKERIDSLSMPQLKLKVAQARKLRDKWRDQAAKQTRAGQAKQRGRQVVGNARSAEKAELFAEVLGRFEAELAKPKAERGEAKRPRKAAPLKIKVQGHRADRAEIRGEIKEKKLQLKAEAREKRPATAAKAAMSPAAKGAPSSAAEAKVAQMPAETKTTPAKSSKARGLAKIPSATAAAGASGLTTSKRQQLNVGTKAKQNRLKAAGVVRIQKHVSAQNKRRQGKRDSR